MKINTYLNYDPADYPCEVNSDPSLTVPEQSMSMRDILQRSAEGFLMEGRDPEWADDDVDFDDAIPYSVDPLTEIADAHRFIDDLEDAYASAKAEAEKAAQQPSIEQKGESAT